MTRPFALTLALGLLLGGCGRVVSKGGEPRTPSDASTVSASPKPARLEPLDLIPGDLDLVVRLDVASIRSTLGQAPTEALLRRAQDGAATDEATRSALLDGDRVWLATRLADFGEGDRVLIVESARTSPATHHAERWVQAASGADGVARYIANDAPRRNGVAEMYEFARARVFVSPVEAASVRRVVKRGPDPNRGDPEARGLVSLAVRLGRPSREFVSRHPSLGRLLAGIERLDAVVEVNERGLTLRARLRCATRPSASKLASFLSAFREASTERPRLAAALGTLSAEANDATVSVRWSLPTEVVSNLLEEPSDPIAPAAEPSPALHSSPSP